ncbi:3-phenylpropionate/cinnamic acid dioxygenase small subunit [Saccharothrix carnea]|uniref:3-phenylpropionate/cinnamic acid dioxygenase small subunit n=1 Tax=Saccharothrix carnea TaxID=1280637 RepID=A0A2P8I2I1_SACCR|nr:nuclear transport factor 2 family protein [Saccharothrix carnea]PSL52673.1 3-phenylpropionate/cinnamic acid dioxygenase small subunit [Saccharothrix carnea]
MTADLLASVQQFYGRQMRLSEDGAVDEWAATFTEDAVFEDSTEPEPLRGRDAIRESVRRGVARIAAADLDFRHWFGMVDVEPDADGGVFTRYAALAVVTPRGGTAALLGNADCHDHLVPSPGGWLVRHRAVRFDGT